MATLKNNKQRRERLTKGDVDTYYTKFGDGRANFWAAPVSSNEDMDMKMKIYEDGDLIETVSNEGESNRNVLAKNVRVRQGVEYKVKIYHKGGPSGYYNVKVRGPKEEDIDENINIGKLSFEDNPKKGEKTKVYINLSRDNKNRQKKYTVKFYVDGDLESKEDIYFFVGDRSHRCGLGRVKFDKGGKVDIKIEVCHYNGGRIAKKNFEIDVEDVVKVNDFDFNKKPVQYFKTDLDIELKRDDKGNSKTYDVLVHYDRDKKIGKKSVRFKKGDRYKTCSFDDYIFKKSGTEYIDVDILDGDELISRYTKKINVKPFQYGIEEQVITYNYDDIIRESQASGFPEISTGSNTLDNFISGLVLLVCTKNPYVSLGSTVLLGIIQDSAKKRKEIFKNACIEAKGNKNVKLKMFLKPNLKSEYPKIFVDWKLTK